MDKVNGVDISAHLGQMVRELVEAVILAETTDSDIIRLAAETRAVLVGQHLYDDLDYFGPLAAKAINAQNEDNMVEELMSDISNL